MQNLKTVLREGFMPKGEFKKQIFFASASIIILLVACKKGGGLNPFLT
tara:strand:- start:64 stop:207 length:144 start_codon:yes stop_codon:yes gene_type:complete